MQLLHDTQVSSFIKTVPHQEISTMRRSTVRILHELIHKAIKLKTISQLKENDCNYIITENWKTSEGYNVIDQ